MTEDGNLAPQIMPDLGKSRGLSKATLDLFSVSVNGTGWYWETKLKGGGTGKRWKSFYSARDLAPEEARKGWKKYLWIPEKPDGADYFVAPSVSMTNVVKANQGELYLVGGEIAAMSMIEAGFDNTTCFFGDQNIPDTLADDLKRMGVKQLTMIPDRDEAGLQCAYKVRERLKDTDIVFRCYALPFPLEPKHGKDINDLWLDCTQDVERFTRKIITLDVWTLPERTEEPIRVLPDTKFISDHELSADFIRDIERALEVYPQYNSEGWSRRNVRCPFHDDETASANWNHNKAILKCFVCAPAGRTHYLAAQVGEYYGLRLSSYNSVPVATGAPALKIVPKEDTNEVPKVTVKSEPQGIRPPLPKEAQLTPDQVALAVKGRKWVDEYIDWAKIGTLYVPDSFHEACALWLLATVATRRLKFNNGVDIYPNLYVMIVATTTRFHKSTAFKQVNRVLQKANLEPLLLPIDVTPEALFDELAGVKPNNFELLSTADQENWLIGRAVAAQRSIFKDEASSILANLRKEYNAGLTELLLQGYDGDGGKLKKLLKGKGLTMVKDMCLSFLGATTPIMWGKYIGAEEHENGFAARFAVITPDCTPEYCYPGYSAPVPQSMIESLRRLYIDILPWHEGKKPSAARDIGELVSPPVMDVHISEGAHQQLNAYLKALTFDMMDGLDDAKAASYGRLATMAFKVAMLLAAIQTEHGHVKIEDQHAYAAQQICERWRESLYRLERDVAKANGSLEDKVLAYLRTTGENGASLRDLMRDCAIKDKTKALNTLDVIADDGMIEKFNMKQTGPGRPSWRYRVVLREG